MKGGKKQMNEQMNENRGSKRVSRCNKNLKTNCNIENRI